MAIWDTWILKKANKLEEKNQRKDFINLSEHKYLETEILSLKTQLNLLRKEYDIILDENLGRLTQRLATKQKREETHIQTPTTKRLLGQGGIINGLKK